MNKNSQEIRNFSREHLLCYWYYNSSCVNAKKLKHSAPNPALKISWLVISDFYRLLHKIQNTTWMNRKLWMTLQGDNSHHWVPIPVWQKLTWSSCELGWRDVAGSISRPRPPKSLRSLLVTRNTQSPPLTTLASPSLPTPDTWTSRGVILHMLMLVVHRSELQGKVCHCNFMTWQTKMWTDNLRSQDV